jgi:hypothetical protein
VTAERRNQIERVCHVALERDIFALPWTLIASGESVSSARKTRCPTACHCAIRQTVTGRGRASRWLPQRAVLAMPRPVRELRRVQVIPAQEGAQLAGLLARVGLREDAEPILCGDRRRCAFAGISGSGSVARDVVHFHGCRPKTPAGRHARRTSGTRPLPPPASGGPRCEATSTCASPQTYARDGSWKK